MSLKNDGIRHCIPSPKKINYFLGQKTGNRPVHRTPGLLVEKGGVLGNLDDEQKIRRHQGSIPEMMRMVMEFEKSRTGGQVGSRYNRHHEMYQKFKDDFRCDVLLLVDVFEKLGYPARVKDTYNCDARISR